MQVTDLTAALNELRLSDLSRDIQSSYTTKNWGPSPDRAVSGSALRGEVKVELGLEVDIVAVADSYSGVDLMNDYPNGDVVSYVTTAYLCRLAEELPVLETEELTAVGWFFPLQIKQLDLPVDHAALMQFMMSNEFRLHVNARPSRTDLERKTSRGAFGGPDHASFWVQSKSEGRVGLVILEDLLDDAPLFDLRLSANARGRGLGALILHALTADVFKRWQSIRGADPRRQHRDA